MAEFVGRHVKLVLKDGKEFQGYVHSVDQSTGKLTLERVLNCTTKKRIPGFRCYFGNEIASVEVLEDVKKKKETVKENDLLKPEKREAGPRILHTKHVPPHLHKLRDFGSLQQSSNLYRRSQSDEEISDRKSNRSDKSSDNDSGDGTSDLDLSESTTDQPYILLSKTNRDFDQAIMDIKKESVIGVALEGVCIGRKGKLCWLQVGTRDSIYLFDVLTMQDSCFEYGLKDILEDEDILKVIHDCRLPSDILYHQYQIEICNVFDTQVADVFVYRLHMGRGDWPRYVKGLAAALLDHLGLSEDQIYSLAVRQNFKKEDQEVWAQRPARRQILELAMKNVMYLRELRIVLMEKMLAEFVAGVDVYLSQVKGASQDDAKKYQSQQHLLPVAFNELPALMTDRNNYRWQRKSRNLTKPTDPQGFTENCKVTTDSYGTRDSTRNNSTGKSKPSTTVAENKMEQKEDKTKLDILRKSNMNGELMSSRNVTSPVTVSLNDISNSDKENEPVGAKMRRLMKQQQSDSDFEGKSEDEFLFKPAGEMQYQGIDQKKRRKQMEKYDSINIETDQKGQSSVNRTMEDMNSTCTPCVVQNDLPQINHMTYSSDGPQNTVQGSRLSRLSNIVFEKSPKSDFSTSQDRRVQETSPSQKNDLNGHASLTFHKRGSEESLSHLQNSLASQSDIDLSEALKNTTNKMEKLSLLKELLDRKKAKT